VKHWHFPLLVLATLSTSAALADDFKTIDGKETRTLRSAAWRRTAWWLRRRAVFPKSILPSSPKDVQDRFHYDPQKAAAAQAAAVQQTQQINEFNKQAEEAAKQRRCPLREAGSPRFPL
jgi:hypothetical protein